MADHEAMWPKIQIQVFTLVCMLFWNWLINSSMLLNLVYGSYSWATVDFVTAPINSTFWSGVNWDFLFIQFQPAEQMNDVLNTVYHLFGKRPALQPVILITAFQLADCVLCRSQKASGGSQGVKFLLQPKQRKFHSSSRSSVTRQSLEIHTQTNSIGLSLL